MPRTKQLSDRVLSILSTATIEGQIVILNCGQLDRKTYQEVNDALVALGGKWDRKAKGHVFSGDPREKIEDAILTGEVTPPTKNGYFPTPAPIVEQLIDLAGIVPRMTVLEPSAGRGNISNELIKRGCHVCVFEMLPENRKVLEVAPGELEPFLYPEPDFMKFDPGQIFDAVVMNPPFEKQADIDHVNKAYGHLKPGGRLVSVMAAGITFREDKKARGLRELIENSGGEIIPLPEGAFKESGTMVRTVIAVIPKAVAWMPPKGWSIKKQIVELTKELNLAQGTLRNKDTQIGALEKANAEKNRVIEDRCRTIGELVAGNEETTQSLYERNEQYDRLCKQNIALRKALKEVL
jgi:hypothetical protein